MWCFTLNFSNKIRWKMSFKQVKSLLEKHVSESSLVLFQTCPVDPLMLSSLWHISINQCTGSDLWPPSIKLSPHGVCSGSEECREESGYKRLHCSVFVWLCIPTYTHMSPLFILLNIIEKKLSVVITSNKSLSWNLYHVINFFICMMSGARH